MTPADVSPFDPSKRARRRVEVVSHRTPDHPLGREYRAACRDCRWLSAAHPEREAAKTAGVEHHLAAHHHGGNTA